MAARTLNEVLLLERGLLDDTATYTVATTATPVDNTWHQFILSAVSGDDYILYVDGLAGTSIIAGAKTDVDGTLHTAKDLDLCRAPDNTGKVIGNTTLLVIESRAWSAEDAINSFREERHLFGV